MISTFLKVFRVASKSSIFGGPVRLPNAIRPPVRFIETGLVNTNVAKDVILFSYENPKYFKLMNIFAVCQYVFWCYFGHFCFVDMKDAPVKKTEITESTPWYMKINLGENKYRNTLGTVAFFIGFGTLSLSWMYTLKSVRHLVLHKGGQHVSFVTYTPFGPNRIMKVDLKYVSSSSSRHGSRVHLPIKVHNKLWYYLLDMRGEFRNRTLFDHTAGLKRSFDFRK